MTAAKLNCPECGVALIPPHGRGLYTDDGEFAEHHMSCLCGQCDWMWFDDEPPLLCECGTYVRVKVDDGTAYAVSECEPPAWQ